MLIIITVLFTVVFSWPALSQLPVKLTEHGTKLTFDATCFIIAFIEWVFHVVLYSIASYSLYAVVDQLPRLGKNELVFLLLFTCSFVVSVWWMFLFLLVLGMGCAFFIVALPGPSINYFVPRENLRIPNSFSIETMSLSEESPICKYYGIFILLCIFEGITTYINRPSAPVGQN